MINDHKHKILKHSFMQCTFQKLLSSLIKMGQRLTKEGRMYNAGGRRGFASDAESARGFAKDHTFPYNLEDFRDYHMYAA